MDGKESYLHNNIKQFSIQSSSSSSSSSEHRHVFPSLCALQTETIVKNGEKMESTSASASASDDFWVKIPVLERINQDVAAPAFQHLLS
jgi:hypothetical protein